MREKSQLEDMRAAVRGDLERARARREADPWRPQDPETTAEEPTSFEAPEPGPAPQGRIPEGSVPAEPEPTPVPEPEQQEEAEAEPPGPSAAPPPASEPAAPKRGFFARLFGR
jgi:hypothetical protein